MGLFKKKFCVVIVGNLERFTPSVDPKEKDRYYNEAGYCVHSEFGDIEYEVETVNDHGHWLEAIRDIVDRGFAPSPDKKPMINDDKQELHTIINNCMKKYGLTAADVRRYESYSDLRKGQFMLLCETRK